MTVFSRKEILVVGGRELSPLPFDNRGLVLKSLRVEAITESDLATACGILVAEPVGQYREIRALADRGAQKAFAMGLMIGIWPANAQARVQAELFRDGIPAASQPHSLPPNDGRRWIEIQDDLEVLAESLRVHDPGPHAGNPEIKSYDPDFKIQSEPEAEVIRTFILKRIGARRLSENEVLAPRVTTAMGHGFTGTPDQLQVALADAAKGMKSRRGIYHGDLHLANIMVRQRDSIVIDFGSMGDFGPITADPAALEASIVFGTRPLPSDELQKEWRDYVDQLYRFPLIPPLPSTEHFQFAWTNRAVRELRHVVFCCGASEPEMLLMLSASLLRFARFSPAGYRDEAVQRISEERKAYALVIAQRVYHEALKAPNTP